MPLVRSVNPTNLAIAVDDVRDSLGLDNAVDDLYLQRLIREATSVVENRYDISVMSQTWVLYQSSWHEKPYYKQWAGIYSIELPKPPFSAVSSIAYTDQNGDAQTWSESSTGYQLANHGHRVRIRPAYNQNWPTLRGVLDSVVITWTAGAASYQDVPWQVKHAIRGVVTHRYEMDCMPDDEWWHGLDQFMIGEDASMYS